MADMTRIGRPKNDNAKRKSLTFRLSEETYHKLLSYAESHNKTLTEVALQSLEEFLSKQK